MDDNLFQDDDKSLVRDFVNHRTQLTQMANLVLEVEPIDETRLKKLAARYKGVVLQENALRNKIRMRVAGPLPLWVEKYG